MTESVSAATVKNPSCGDLIRGAHQVGESNCHLQFTPYKRRAAFLSEKVRSVCRAFFEQKARALGLLFFALEFGPDHCHLFVGNCRKYSVSALAQHFKGGSSFVLRRDCRGELPPQLAAKKFWSGGYFYETVGRVTAESIKFYIERQQGKHWEGRDFELYADRLAREKYWKGQQRLSAFCS